MTTINPEPKPKPKTVRIFLSSKFKARLVRECRPGQGIQEMIIEKLHIEVPHD
jgi:hypothetical protein